MFSGSGVGKKHVKGRQTNWINLIELENLPWGERGGGQKGFGKGLDLCIKGQKGRERGTQKSEFHEVGFLCRCTYTMCVWCVRFKPLNKTCFFFSQRSGFDYKNPFSACIGLCMGKLLTSGSWVPEKGRKPQIKIGYDGEVSLYFRKNGFFQRAFFSPSIFFISHFGSFQMRKRLFL